MGPNAVKQEAIMQDVAMADIKMDQDSRWEITVDSGWWWLVTVAGETSDCGAKIHVSSHSDQQSTKSQHQQ
jgi:hypothetical protein